jgi:hypothetical protein
VQQRLQDTYSQILKIRVFETHYGLGIAFLRALWYSVTLWIPVILFLNGFSLGFVDNFSEHTHFQSERICDFQFVPAYNSGCV